MIEITPEQQTKLDSISNLISNEFKLDNAQKDKFHELNACVSDSSKRLHRSLRQFESDVAIIIVAGMLKAGKSTLINLLARDKNASPVGFGVDTTLRPALIYMGKEDEPGQICVYRNELNQPVCPEEGPDENYQKELAQYKQAYDDSMNAIIDKLRGIHDEESSKKILSPVKYELTQKNLRSVLCKKAGMDNMLPDEPLLVTVRTPYNKEVTLLKSGNYLLDMPGLDSPNAEAALDMDRYTKLIDQCDMAICLQSSVAPLNEKAKRMFSDVLKIRNSATVWVIQNTMLNKPWLEPDAVAKELEEQRVKANALISQLRKGAPLSVTNLGMAYAGYLEDEDRLRSGERLSGYSLESDTVSRESLQNASEFAKVESDLMRSMEENGSRVRFKACVNNLKIQLDNINKVLSKRKEEVNKEIEDRKLERKKWNDFSSDLEQNLAKIECPSDITPNPKCEDLETELESIFTKALASNSKLRQDSFYGSDVNTFLDEISKECQKACEAFLTKFQMKDMKIHQKGDDLGMASFCNKTLDGYMQDIKKALLEKSYSSEGSKIKRLLESDKLNFCQNIENANLPGKESDFKINPKTRSKDYVIKKSIGIQIITFGMWTEGSYEADKTDPEKVWRDDKNKIINDNLKEVKDFLTKRARGWCNDLLQNSVQCGASDFKREVEAEQKSVSDRLNDYEDEKVLIDDLIEVINKCKGLNNSI